jgi:hypothetical protein
MQAAGITSAMRSPVAGGIPTLKDNMDKTNSNLIPAKAHKNEE